MGGVWLGLLRLGRKLVGGLLRLKGRKLVGGLLRLRGRKLVGGVVEIEREEVGWGGC